ncbi:MAG: hypothetical protein ACD_2C00144G0005 [uncultured bacterium (gcode 4)]|uniref:Uncharacterized protein n=1 Tax=uncultured bacterium (gcode 4) TaxID=1234023 RepID=K2H151_9BACT|nr:MAG: hypothetical protein ACD_2C00144G0005 [uncultured bacterium (gcode 4)]
MHAFKMFNVDDVQKKLRLNLFLNYSLKSSYAFI